MKGKFYGGWIVFAAFCTFGLSTGLPYYNMPFFYDYYEKTFGWSRPDITLGYPLAAVLTLWVGPLFVPRFSPRLMIIAGTGLTFLAFFGFSRMTGDLFIYKFWWVIYVAGYILSGPIAHQIIISNWFRRARGRAMGFCYVGIGVVGSLGSFLAKPLAEHFGFQSALLYIGLLVVLCAWPIAFFLLRDKPSQMGQHPDGEAISASEVHQPPRAFSFLLSKPAFWLLLIGSMCSIGAIGSINQHMKLVFKDQGFTDQATLNSIWQKANVLILWSSIAGRLLVGWMADRFSRKTVMIGTYGLVAVTIPLLLLVRPGGEWTLYAFSLLFGFGMGADFMLIPLMAADQFGLTTLARAMAIILPTDTIGQTWFPYGVAKLRQAWGSYDDALLVVFAMAAVGAVAIALLPKPGGEDVSEEDQHRGLAPPHGRTAVQQPPGS
jgi:MFS family permease